MEFTEDASEIIISIIYFSKGRKGSRGSRGSRNRLISEINHCFIPFQWEHLNSFMFVISIAFVLVLVFVFMFEFRFWFGFRLGFGVGSLYFGLGLGLCLVFTRVRLYSMPPFFLLFRNPYTVYLLPSNPTTSHNTNTHLSSSPFRVQFLNKFSSFIY